MGLQQFFNTVLIKSLQSYFTCQFGNLLDDDFLFNFLPSFFFRSAIPVVYLKIS